jgi:hypothetical protein
VAVVTKMSKKRQSTALSAIRVKNWWKTIGNEVKLDVMSIPVKGEQIADI